MLATEWSTKRWISQLRRSARGVMLLRTSSRSSECTLSRRDKNSSNWEICQCPTWPQGFPCTMGLKVFTGTYWQFHRRLLCWFKQTNKQKNYFWGQMYRQDNLTFRSRSPGYHSFPPCIWQVLWLFPDCQGNMCTQWKHSLFWLLLLDWQQYGFKVCNSQKSITW